MALTFGDFFEKLSTEQQEVVAYLDKQFISELGLTRKIRYKIPFYDKGSWICYLNPIKGNKIELCFMKGKILASEHKVLQTKGRKMIAGMIIDPLEDIPIKEIIVLVNSAICLVK